MKAILIGAFVLSSTAWAEDPVQQYTAAYVALARQAASGLEKVSALVDPKDCGSVDKAMPVATRELKEHEKLLADYRAARKGLTPEQQRAGAKAAMATLMPEFQQSQGADRAASDRIKAFKAACPKQSEQAEAQLKPLMQKIPRD